MNDGQAQKTRTGAQLDDTPKPAPAPLYKRPVIQPATAVNNATAQTDKTRSGAELAPNDGYYAPGFTGGQTTQNTGNLFWLWGIGAAIGAYLVFRPKPKRRTKRR